ncbi:glycerophosphodiester phosphodiesterase [Beduini massiliensis]|uniref:glycerophosphodiester phosphodiesterase n=1 Tax=Beduini massiliensis TaxID=1585974 RepID=UPI00059AB5F9|nr:glycerophosphodiester phosphodiesterase [Beduini massiliensis]
MKVYAHRGASDQYPENTMLAFTQAIEKGADGIEADVQLSKDGICVLIHDETINRTSNGMGWVKDYTYRELLEFEFNNGKDVEEWVKIPNLEQLLALAKEKKIPLVLDLKTDCIDYIGLEEKVYDLVKKYGLLDQVIFSSSNMDSLTKLKGIDPTIQAGYVFERRFEDNAIKARHYKIEYLHPRYSMLTDNIVKKALENGLKLNVWTPNKEENLEMVNDYGVNMCITNRVLAAKKIVNKEKS